jgi:hypothetical protein
VDTDYENGKICYKIHNEFVNRDKLFDILLKNNTLLCHLFETITLVGVMYYKIKDGEKVSHKNKIKQNGDWFVNTDGIDELISPSGSRLDLIERIYKYRQKYYYVFDADVVKWYNQIKFKTKIYVSEKGLFELLYVKGWRTLFNTIQTNGVIYYEIKNTEEVFTGNKIGNFVNETGIAKLILNKRLTMITNNNQIYIHSQLNNNYKGGAIPLKKAISMVKNFKLQWDSLSKEEKIQLIEKAGSGVLIDYVLKDEDIREKTKSLLASQRKKDILSRKFINFDRYCFNGDIHLDDCWQLNCIDSDCGCD